jgi:NitT/TauT family transport system substrate-binding protein
MKAVGYRLFFVSLLFILVTNLSACTQASPAETESLEPINLKIAVLPILEALPMYVAEQEGLFEKHGVEVEFVAVASAPERDQVISAGQADGMINELTSTMFYNKDQPQVKIVRYARTATPEQALFRILASGESGINSIDGLKGARIGISQGTIIEYLTDRLLQAQGFTAEEINTVAVPKIPDRMALLESGELDAGMLPEPLSSLAVLQGSKIVLDDTSLPEISFSTLTFRNEVLDQNPQAVRGFLAAIEESTSLINTNPTQWIPLLGEYNLVPPPLLESFQIPQFAEAGIPTEAQWSDVLDWAIEKGFLDGEVSYQESVSPDYLP